MTRKLIPFAAAIALLLFFIGPGRGFLPTALPGRPAVSAAPQVADHAHDATTGNASTIGLAPSPVTSPASTAARVNVAVTAAPEAARGYVIAATALGPDGRPLADAPLRFYELVDLFGTREMQIGSGTSDGRGVVTLTYLPAQPGTHDLVVRTSAVGKVTAGEGRTSFDASVSAPQSKVERPLLAIFSDRVPYAAGLIVLSVWSLIAFALFATARGVIRGARRTTRKGEPA